MNALQEGLQIFPNILNFDLPNVKRLFEGFYTKFHKINDFFLQPNIPLVLPFIDMKN